MRGYVADPFTWADRKRQLTQINTSVLSPVNRQQCLEKSVVMCEFEHGMHLETEVCLPFIADAHLALKSADR
jgi:hypothetical protein